MFGYIHVSDTPASTSATPARASEPTPTPAKKVPGGRLWNLLVEIGSWAVIAVVIAGALVGIVPLCPGDDDKA